MDGEVYYSDAKRVAADILRKQRQLGIPEMGYAATPEEAAVKARLLLDIHGEEERARPREKTRCVGSIPNIADNPTPGRGTKLVISHSPEGPANGRAAFIGDKVSLHPDSAYVRVSMEITQQGWNDLIEEYCGKTGKIVKIVSVQQVIVAFPDTNTWVLPASVLVRAPEEEDPAIASPKRVRKPRDAETGPLKALLIADTIPGLEDCRTAYRYAHDEGFDPMMGVKILGPDLAAEPSEVSSALAWLCDDVRPGDSLFLVLSYKGGPEAHQAGEGVGSISGGALLDTLRHLPENCKLTCIVGAHCAGGGAALLDLPYTLCATREGGLLSSQRPFNHGVVADVVTIGTWAEGERYVPSPGEPAELELIAPVVAALSQPHPTSADVFVKDVRARLMERFGYSTPLPKVAATVPLHGSTKALSLNMVFSNTLERRVPDAGHIPSKEYTALAAARLLGPSEKGKCIALGDAEARAWIIFTSSPTVGIDEATGELTSRIAVYNGHPCFVLEVYNWVENDEAKPLGDTTIGPHHTRDGLVYKLSVVPGETKLFIEGALRDGEGWRPGWRQTMIPDKVFAHQETLLQSEAARSHAKTRAVLDVLAIRDPDGGDQPDTAFSSSSLLTALGEVNTSQGLIDRPEHLQQLSPNTVFCSFYDMWFPPNQASLGEKVGMESESTGDDLLWGRPTEYATEPYEVHTPGGRNSSRATQQQQQHQRRGKAGQPPPILPANQDAILPNDVSGGKLRNTRFVSAMACVAERPSAIQALFTEHRREYLQLGAVRLQLCVKGWWQDVTVDTYLPLVRRPITSVILTPAGTHSVKRLAPGPEGRGSLWASFVEKGAAKVYGSYEELLTTKDTSVDFLKMLTGCGVATHPLNGLSPSRMRSYMPGPTGQTSRIISPEFEDLCSWADAGDLLVLFPLKRATRPSSYRDTRHSRHTDFSEVESGDGLTHQAFSGPRSSTVYPVIQYNRKRRAVCVRDVWSPASDVWEAEMLYEKPVRLPVDPDEDPEGERLGEFGYGDDEEVKGGRWIAAHNLHTVFGRVARVRPPRGGELRVWMTWAGRYPVFLLKVDVATETTFNVTCTAQHCDAQPDLTTHVLSRSKTSQHISIMETFSGPFEFTLFPNASPVYLAVPEPPPCDEGAVIELLYRAKSSGSGVGRITAEGPASTYLKAVEKGVDVCPLMCFTQAALMTRTGELAIFTRRLFLS